MPVIYVARKIITNVFILSNYSYLLAIQSNMWHIIIAKIDEEQFLLGRIKCNLVLFFQILRKF